MEIPVKQLAEAIEQIAYERKIPAQRIFETVEAALAAAYRKDFGHPEQQVRAKLNQESGETEIYLVYNVVDEVENPNTDLTVAEAKKKGMKEAKAGDEYVERVDPPADYGRIAAQTAKQVIIQRIREVEREIVQEEFSDRVGELMTGSVQRIEGRNVFVEVGRAIGMMGPYDQINSERYYIGQRLRVMLKEVDSEGRGAQLLLTRAHPDFVRRLFELEVPEIHAGTVEIKSIAREAGVRTKVAVASNQEGVDPVGTCVGQRGTRVQAIMAELGEEKIDIVLYDENPDTYIRNALSPAKISRIDLHEDTKTADIHVADDQLSLAIGRGGQNVRLAGELTGWQLDIEKNEGKGDSGDGVVAGIPLKTVAEITDEEREVLEKAGVKTAQQLAAATDEEVADIAEDRRVPLINAASAAVSAADEATAEEAEEPTLEETAAENADVSPEESAEPAPNEESPAETGTEDSGEAETVEDPDAKVAVEASGETDDAPAEDPAEKPEDDSASAEEEADPDEAAGDADKADEKSS